MKYLVTGGAGFIGSNLCRKLLTEDHSVICLDDLSTGKRSNILELENNSAFIFVNHDLTKPYFPDSIDGIFSLVVVSLFFMLLTGIPLVYPIIFLIKWAIKRNK